MKKLNLEALAQATGGFVVTSVMSKKAYMKMRTVFRDVEEEDDSVPTAADIKRVKEFLKKLKFEVGSKNRWSFRDHNRSTEVSAFVTLQKNHVEYMVNSSYASMAIVKISYAKFTEKFLKDLLTRARRESDMHYRNTTDRRA